MDRICETGASDIAVEEKYIKCYHYKKIDAKDIYGYALLAAHVYSVDGQGDIYLRIPGYNILGADEMISLLKLEGLVEKYKEDLQVLNLKKLSGQLKCELCKGGFAQICDDMRLILRKDGGIYDDSSGFKAAIYKKNDYKYKDKVGFYDKDYVFVIGGSDELGYKRLKQIKNTWTDWIKTNAMQALGIGYPAQYKEAVILGLLLKEKLGDNIMAVGHSLGGGLASAASAASRIHAFVFNPAGMNVEALARYLESIFPSNDRKKQLYDVLIKEEYKRIQNQHLYNNIDTKILASALCYRKIRLICQSNIARNINKKKGLVRAYCSKWDVLTNTQDNESNSKGIFMDESEIDLLKKDNNNADITKFRPEIKNNVSDIKVFVNKVSKLLWKTLEKVQSKCLGDVENFLPIKPIDVAKQCLPLAMLSVSPYLPSLITKLYDKVSNSSVNIPLPVPMTFTKKKILIEIKDLNYLSESSCSTGHGMDLMLDALHLQFSGINNNKGMTYQGEGNIKNYNNYLERQWAEENKKTTILYKIVSEDKKELMCPNNGEVFRKKKDEEFDYQILYKIVSEDKKELMCPNNNEVFRKKKDEEFDYQMVWEKVKSPSFNVKIKYNDNAEEYLGTVNTGKKEIDVYK